MAFDYAPILATARELVQEFGREMTFVKFDATPADASKPWNGPTDARGGGATEATAYAVPVPPSSATELGLQVEDQDMLRRASQILIVEPGTDAPESLETFDEVKDGTVRYRVEMIEKLKPAGTTLLYFFAVMR